MTTKKVFSVETYLNDMKRPPEWAAPGGKGYEINNYEGLTEDEIWDRYQMAIHDDWMIEVEDED